MIYFLENTLPKEVEFKLYYYTYNNYQFLNIEITR